MTMAKEPCKLEIKSDSMSRLLRVRGPVYRLITLPVGATGRHGPISQYTSDWARIDYELMSPCSTMERPRQSGHAIEGYVKIGGKRYSAFAEGDMIIARARKPAKAAGGKRRHGREPEWYELPGKFVLELGKKGFAHVMPDEKFGGWKCRVYDAEGNLKHQGTVDKGGLKHAKEWARMFLDVPAGRGLSFAIHARHARRWAGGKRRHATKQPSVGKQVAELSKLLRK